MTYAETMAALNSRREQIAALQGEMRALQAGVEPQAVEDYVLAGWNGPVRLSELFGDKHDLIVIHNMGVGCSACTMWADGFNGVYDHLAHRAAFVLASPNPVEAQQRFAESRGWRFPMVSYGGSAFAEDMGFWHRGDYPADDALGGWNPGVSIFRRDGERIVRLSEAEFDDHDGFCVVFSLFDLIPGAYDGWKPSNNYA
jgi:predicted dithiol-disulfide oxidoreductase (DUF899 family)